MPTPKSHSAHLPDLQTRRALMKHLSERGIDSVFHYQPLHLSTMGLKFGGRAGQCPVAERAGDDLLRLPLFFGMTAEQMDAVVSALLEFHAREPQTAAARRA